MITVHRVDTWDGNDGRSVEATNYFIDAADANAFCGNNPRQRQLNPLPIQVWEKGEYSPEEAIKQKALAKLTDEEKAALGLIKNVEKCIDSETHEDHNYINEKLKEVRASGLITEVITSALNIMKGEPNLSARQAFQEGCREWDV